MHFVVLQHILLFPNSFCHLPTQYVVHQHNLSFTNAICCSPTPFVVPQRHLLFPNVHWWWMYIVVPRPTNAFCCPQMTFVVHAFIFSYKYAVWPIKWLEICCLTLAHWFVKSLGLLILWRRCVLPFLGSSPKLPMSCRTKGWTVKYVWHYISMSPSRALCPNLSLQAKISACWPKSQPVYPNPNLKTQIPAYSPKSQTQDPNPSHEA